MSSSTGSTGTRGPGAVAASYLALADLLDGLSEASWDVPSLCDGWRVREVVAHLTMPTRYSTPRFLAELVRSRGRFNRMADRCARRDAALPTADLLAALRDPALHAWTPPGGGGDGALTHVVIHSLDVAVPLEIDLRPRDESLRTVLDGLRAPKTLRYFDVDLDEVELHATDLDWTFGTGRPVTGTAGSLALVLSGRRVPAHALAGEGSTRFTAPPSVTGR